MKRGKEKSGRSKSIWFYRLTLLLGMGVLLGATLHVIFCWNTIPEEIPTHFNAAGEIDAIGQERFLLVPLVIGWALYGLARLGGFGEGNAGRRARRYKK